MAAAVIPDDFDERSEQRLQRGRHTRLKFRNRVTFDLHPRCRAPLHRRERGWGEGQLIHIATNVTQLGNAQ